MVDSPLAYYRRVRGKQAFVRAEGLAREGKAAEAAEAFDQAAALSGDDRTLRRHAVEAAIDLYQTLGRAAETAERAEQLADLSPDDPAAILRLARARDIIGRRDDAAAAWVRRLDLAPDCELAPRRLADLLTGAAAIPHLRTLAERAPDDLPSWIRLGDALTAEGDFDGAAQAWTRRLAVAPDCDEAPRRLADLLRGAAALPHIRTLAERAPGDVDAWTRLAQAADALKDAGTAAIGWRRVVELTPEDLTVRRRLITLFGEMGRHADAASQLEAAVALAPGEAHFWKALARARRALGDAEGELRGWSGALAAEPDRPGFRTEVARLLTAAGRTAEAAPHFLALAAQQPDDPEAWRRAGRAFDESGDREAGAEAWTRLLALNGEDIEAHRALAAWHRAGQRPDAAVPHLRFEADRVGGGPAFKRLALTLDQIGDAEGAEAAWRRLLDINPVHAAALDRVVALSRKRGEPEAALGVMQAAVAAGPEDAALLDRLVDLQLQSGDTAGAVATRRKASADRPNDTEALLALVRLQIKTGDGPGAVANLQRAADAHRDDPELLQSLVKLQVTAGDGQGAVANLKRAVAARPGDLDVLRSLVRLQAKLGDASGAIASLHRAADVNPDALQLVAETAARLDGDREALAGLLDRAAQASPDDPELLRGLARSTGARGDVERAFTLWARLLELSPGDADAARAVGMHLYDIGRRAEAASHLALAGAHAPTDIKVWRRLAWARRGEENVEAEIETLRHLLAHITPDDDETKLRLIDLLIGAGRRAESEPLLAEMADRRPDDIRLRTHLARARRDLGDEQGALAAWRQVLEINPGEPDANNAVGEAMLVGGDLKTAIDHLARAAPATAKPAVAWGRISKLRRQAKDHDGELIALQNLIAVAAVKDLAQHRRLAMLLEAQGRHGEAEPYIAFIAEVRPRDVSALRRLAYARHVNGDVEGEAEAWGRLLVQEPEAADARIGLARWRLGRGELAEAIDQLEVVGDAAPADLWAEVARGYEGLSDTAGEIDAWRRALARQPDLIDAHLRLAELLIGLGEGGAAAPHLGAAVEARPDDLRLRERYGVALHGAGRLAEAASHFEAVAQARLTSPKPWKRLGRVLAENGDLEQAVAAWRHVLVLGADDLEASEALGRLLQRLGRYDEAAVYLRGHESPVMTALGRSEETVARLGRLHAAFAQADLKVLDVGARGGPLDWMTLLAPYAAYFACEPEPTEAERLSQALQAAHPWREVRIVPEGLGPEPGEATLRLTAHSGFSSVYTPAEAMAARFGLSEEMAVTGEVTIPVITLAEAAARYGFEDLSLLKIDTQGSELDVLRSGEALLRDHVQVIYAEVEFREFYEGQPLFGDVDAYLRGLGFDLLRLEPVSRRRLTPGRKLAYSRHEVVWAHALFIKRAPEAAALAPEVFLKRTLQQIACAVAYELFDLAADLALAPQAQAAFAAAGLEVTLDDIEAFASAGLARALHRDFAERWPDQVKNVPKSYTG